MKQPTTLIFCQEPIKTEEKGSLDQKLLCSFHKNDQSLDLLIKVKNPNLFISIGEDTKNYPNLSALPIKLRKKWLHYKTYQDAIKNIDQIIYCFVHHGIKTYQEEKKEKISLFTTSYNSGKFINRAFQSLFKQTYENWEWIIYDDSNGTENFENLKRLQILDNRVKIFRADKNSGVIGKVKHIASKLCDGAYLIELDHDDELTPDALEKVHNAFQEFPDAGFVYSDFCEIYEDGKSFNYSELFALGFGAYRNEWDENRNKWISVCSSPPINAATIRYLVSCPNHLRAWRKSTFDQIGGWNPNFHVADDFEILVRTFLNTRMVRIPHMCYYQYRNEGGNNHTQIRNAEIQKLWKTISKYYNKQINERLINLGVTDPFLENWHDWSQFGKNWKIDRDNSFKGELPNLNYISETQERNTLVSIVLTCNKETNVQNLVSRLNNAMEQKWDGHREIVIVGVDCQTLFKTVFQGNSESNRKYQVPFIKWWNLDEGTMEDMRNFACKMICLGSHICYWDHSAEKGKRTANYLKIQYMHKNFNKTGWIKDFHRTELLAERGYWQKGIDLNKN